VLFGNGGVRIRRRKSSDDVAVRSRKGSASGQNATVVTKWRRSLGSEWQEAGVGLVRPGRGRRVGLRAAAGQARPRNDVVWQ
jgi:hypothetical protein